MRRWGLKQSSIAYCICLVLATTVVLSIGFMWHTFQRLMQERTASAQIYSLTLAHNAEPALHLNDNEMLSKIVDGALDDRDVRWAEIYDESMKRVAHSSKPDEAATAERATETPAQPGDTASRVKLRVDYSRGVFTVSCPVWSNVDDVDLGLLAEDDVPKPSTAKPIGFLAICYSLDSLYAALWQAAMSSMLLALSVIAVASMITIAFVGRLLKPVRQLIATTSAIAEGDLARRASEEGVADVRELASAFNHMAVQVQQGYSSIEATVAQRTMELQNEIIEREHAVQEMREAKDNAEAANLAKSEFLANMSHELRTPLNGVLGMLEVLQAAHLEDKHANYVRTAKASADALLHLISDILDLAKVEAGKMELEAIEFDLWGIVEDTAEIMALKAAQKGLELACFVSPSVDPHVLGDPGRLQQILFNLVGNAIKFTEHGEVVVHVEPVEDDGRELQVKFTVRDTGIGIPPERLGRLFKTFSQVDASTTRKYGGTGLGLRICKQITELMGGQIGIESEKGTGSTFWFIVPLRKLDRPVELAERRTRFEQLDGLHVLVVDDHETNRQILNEQLSVWNVVVETCEDGPSALVKLRERATAGSPFQLAIIDMQMPGMDGAELGRLIKNDPQLCETHLVMLTSIGNEADRGRLLKAGFAAVASKPIKQVQLMDRIIKALSEEPAEYDADVDVRQEAEPRSNEIPYSAARILLVEDNEINRDVAINMLEMLHYRTDVAENGQLAVEAVRAERYDVVLMDCQMPVMDGFEATRQIRADEQAHAGDALPRPTPIIAVTANALTGDRERCITAGMDDYITKPLEPAVLKAAIDRVLARRSPPDGSVPCDRASAVDVPKDGTGVDESLIRHCAVDELLNRCLGNVELAERLIKQFADQAEELMAGLEASFAAGDISETASLAHKLKGASASLALRAVNVAAARLEQHARAEGMSQIDACLQDLREELLSCTRILPQIAVQLPSCGSGKSTGGAS